MEIKTKNSETHAFYTEAIDLLNDSGFPFLLGGAFAIFHHTGIYRDTKDLDVFIKATDYPGLLKYFAAKGFEVQVHDVRWLAKIWKGDYFIDLIFNTVSNICKVDDSWFARSKPIEIFGRQVKVLAPEELIFCKSYIWNRERFDGADINHLMLKCGKEMDWKHLLSRLDQHWHMLLAEVIMFQFVYPSDYQDIIPRWLFDDLVKRAQEQYDLPQSIVNICRGPIIDNTQYSIDIKDWNYKSCTIMTI